MILEVKFTKERETKNTVRYQEQEEEGFKIGTLYIQKSALGSNPPSQIEVTITDGEK